MVILLAVACIVAAVCAVGFTVLLIADMKDMM